MSSTLFPDMMDANISPTMATTACIVCLLVILHGAHVTEAPGTILSTCRDEASHKICGLAITNPRYCSPSNPANKCRESCGLCDSTTVSTSGLDTCRDETTSTICGEAMKSDEYCNPSNTNNKCKQSCGLCGGQTTSVPCSDQRLRGECMAIIASIPSYCNSAIKNNPCQMSCGLCTKTQPDASVQVDTCKDDLTECSDIIKANESYCDPLNANNQCKRTCGVCGGQTTSVPCSDQRLRGECMAIIASIPSYCNSTIKHNQCQMSCGLCKTQPDASVQLDTCKDDLTECSDIIKANESYCDPLNANNQCKRTCGVCGGQTTSVPCSDQLGRDECMAIIASNGSYCNSTIKNNPCQMSCGLCTKTQPGASVQLDTCKDDLTECSDIIKANESYCDPLNANNQCKRTCGVCGGQTTSVPCSDQLGRGECMDIIASNGSYCNSTMKYNPCQMSCGLCTKTQPDASVQLDTCKDDLTECSDIIKANESYCDPLNANNQCKRTCGVCDASCRDNLPWTLCSELVKKEKYCSRTVENGCQLSCGLCSNGRRAGTTAYPGNVTTDEEVNPSPTTLNQTLDDVTTQNQTSDDVTTQNQTSDDVTTQNQTSDIVTTQNQTSDIVTTQNQTSDIVTTQNQTSDHVTTAAGVYPSLMLPNQTTESSTNDPNSQGSNSSKHAQQTSSRTNESNPLSNETIRLNLSKGNLALGKPSWLSSMVAGGEARNANDGKNGTDAPDCSHTDLTQVNPWWRVDLQGIYTITSVAILNRQDCCCERLNGVTIDVDSKDRDLPEDADDSVRNCDVDFRPFACGEKRVLQCGTNTWGRYVWIKQPMPGLTLCEVEVYGKLVTGTECPLLKNSNFPSKNFLPTFSTNRRSVGTHVKVQECARGRTLMGARNLKCLPNLQWDNPIPICIENIKTNLAYLKMASQSSTLVPGQAKKAVDGDVGLSSLSCSTTGPSDTSPRWTVDLGGRFRVATVIVVNRRDCCCHLLSNITIAVEERGVSPVVCSTNILEFACGEMRSFSCPLNAIGSRVYIEKPTPTLALCEVVIQGKRVRAKGCPSLKGTQYVLSSFNTQVGSDVTITKCTNGLAVAGPKRLKCLPNGRWNKPLPMCLDTRDNLALNKRTYLSSAQQLHERSASRANDGVFDHSYVGSACSVSHPHDSSPWWQVDLQDIYKVQKVTITSRHDPSCKGIQGVHVFVYKEGITPRNPRSKGTMCSMEQIKLRCSRTAIISCKPDVVGRYVRVAKHGHHLSLCEVMVKGRKQARKACPPLEDNRLPTGLFNRDNLNRLRVGATSRSVGKRLSVSCYNNYRPKGQTKLMCQQNGQWNRQPAVCTAPKKLPWHCPVDEGYFYLLKEDFCFKLETRETSWYEAVKACAATPGGVLAELNTTEKQQAVHEAVQSKEDYRSTDYYIGGSKFVNPGTWTWLSKEPVNPHVSPQKAMKGEQCLSMSSVHGRYIGQKCLTQLGRVCEKRPSVKDTNRCVDSLVPVKCDTKAIEGLCESKKPDAKRTMKYKCKRTCSFCSPASLKRGNCKDKLKYDTCEAIKKRNLCKNPAKRQRCMKTCGICHDVTTPSTTPSHHLQPGASCGTTSSLMSGSVAVADVLDNLPCVYSISRNSSRNQTKLFILNISHFPSPDTIDVTPPPPFDASYSLPNFNHAEMYSFTGTNFTLKLNSSLTRAGTRFHLTWEPAVMSDEAGVEDDMLSVFCNTSSMSVKYKVAGAWKVTLTDPSCTVGFINNTYSITAAFNTCSTTRTETTRRTSFVNQLLFRSMNSGVTREFTRSVTCTFPRSPLVYRSTGVLNTRDPILGVLNTTVWMDIYKGSERMSVFPVTVDYTSSFTILFTSADPGKSPQFQPRDCYMAPSKADRKMFPLITNTCPHEGVNLTRTRRGIYIFVTSRHKLTSTTKAHIFCTVGRCNPPSCGPCQAQHSLPLTQVVHLQQGPFIMMPSAEQELLSSITQSMTHSTMSSTSSVTSSSLADTDQSDNSSVSSNSLADAEAHTGVTEGKRVSTGESFSGRQARPDGENHNANKIESPLSETLNPNWTPSYPSENSDNIRTPSYTSENSDNIRTPSHPSENSDNIRTPSHPSENSDTSRTPSHLSSGSDNIRTPSHPSSEVPMEIPIPESEPGVLEMPSQNETSNDSGMLSTGTAVGVGVGVVMVLVMAITLAMMKYGPGVKIFKRGRRRHP